MVDEEFLTILHEPLYRIALFIYLFLFIYCGLYETTPFVPGGKQMFMSHVQQNVLGLDYKFYLSINLIQRGLQER